MIHILGKKKQDNARFNHATQKSAWFKTYELFISGISYLIFSGFSGPQVTETAESRTVDKGDYCNVLTHDTGLDPQNDFS